LPEFLLAHLPALLTDRLADFRPERGITNFEVLAFPWCEHGGEFGFPLRVDACQLIRQVLRWSPQDGFTGAIKRPRHCLLFPDVIQTSEKLGKSAGKDLASEKSTYPALLGLEGSRAKARRLTQESTDALAIFGDAGLRLKELAGYLLAREY
jgi:hypothetical protein